jgi:hypothetical protein
MSSPRACAAFTSASMSPGRSAWSRKPSPARAFADYSRLGFTVIRGGEHQNGVTHNVLVVLEDGATTGISGRPGIQARPGTASRRARV